MSTPGDSKDPDYFFTPEDIRCRQASQNALCFLDVQQMSKFVEQINVNRYCSTQNCSGSLVVTSLRRSGLGGAARLTFNCDGCQEQQITFDTCRMVDNKSEISRTLHVAFIISGCIYATYTKVLRHSLGIHSTYHYDFNETIRLMHPVVKEMVDEMCTEARETMKKKNPSEYGSWEKAVTLADGAWMTRGHHSQNFTFSVRNYFTGELLYRKHLCQRGRDVVIDEELYQGTSHGAEGYAATMVFQQAKEDGMELAINWQDNDSFSSKAIKKIFPKAEVMICRGHEGRAHLNQLKKLKKMKSFTKDWIKSHQKYVSRIPQITCKCQKIHKKNCGCITDGFIVYSRNLLSSIIKCSDTAEEYAKRVRSLYKHAIGDHSECDFHKLTVCSCGRCPPDEEKLNCKGKPYRSRHRLHSCKFHKLLYKVEINYRATKAEKLIHKDLKAGHTHIMEASHNIYIRYRSKHIALERLHYHVATDLALLQANLSAMREKKGNDYHWIPELYQRLGLPLYEGIQTALLSYCQTRDSILEKTKEEESKRKRISWKIQRRLDGEQRKKWSKEHGGDWYGQEPTKSRKPCECGSTKHSRTSHSDCPRNKKYRYRMCA